MFPPPLQISGGFAILEEDAVRADLGDCIGFDLGHVLGHVPCMIEVYVG
jgi:hypothetical protein